MALHPILTNLKRLSRVAPVYKETLTEVSVAIFVSNIHKRQVQRRNKYSAQLQHYVQSYNTLFTKLRDTELAKRLAFQKSHGDSLLTVLSPFLVKSEEDEKKLSLAVASVPKFDQDVPVIDSVPVSLEDDFSLVTEGFVIFYIIIYSPYFSYLMK